MLKLEFDESQLPEYVYIEDTNVHGSYRQNGGQTVLIQDFEAGMSASETQPELKGLFDDATLYSLWADQSDCWKICSVPGYISCN